MTPTVVPVASFHCVAAIQMKIPTADSDSSPENVATAKRKASSTIVLIMAASISPVFLNTDDVAYTHADDYINKQSAIIHLFRS